MAWPHRGQIMSGLHIVEAADLITSGPQVFVPADLIARSRPSRHSVPIARMKRKLERVHPYRNVVVALLVALVALSAVTIAVYHSMDMGRAAGYRLTCSVVGIGKSARSVCHWEK